MKIKSVFTITIIALLPLAGFAQTPPAPPQPPQPPGPPGMPGHHEKGPKVPVTYLGVETSQVPPVVSEQLGLGKGLGLVVDYVEPNSPAAAGGVQQNDILKMLNDQILIEPSQLRKLLQTFPDGTEVTLTVLRKGQEQKEQLKEQLGDAQHGIIHGAVMQAHEAARRAKDDARRAADELRIFFEDNGAMKASRIDLGKAQIVFSNDKGELKLENVDGKKLLTAKDRQGKLLFSGPVETEEDLARVPADVRERYEKLQQSDLRAVAPRHDNDTGSDADTEDADDDDDDDGENPEPSSQHVSFNSSPSEIVPNSISF